MKLFNKIIIILLLLFFGTINVKAANNDFTVENISIEEKNETIKVSNPSYNDNNIESTIEFNKTGDYVKYKIVLNNNTDIIYKIKDVKYDNSNEYINISYEYNNGEINPHEQFELFVTLKYIDEVYSDELIYNLDDISLKIKMEKIIKEEVTKEDSNIIEEEKVIINDNSIPIPNTIDNIKEYLMILLIAIILILVLIKTKINIFIIPIILLLGIVNYAKAESELEVVINIKNNIINIDMNKFDSLINEEIGITKEKIKNIYFVKEEDLPNNVDGSFNISKFNVEKVREYYVKSDDTYDIYIVSNDIFTKYKSKDVSSLFSEFTNLKEVDLSYLDLSNITDMNHMFFSDSNLEKITWPENLNTSKVTDMSYMFRDCNLLKEIDLSNFDTSKVKSMKSMFYKCKSLTNLDVSNFDTANVEEMNFMFLGCSNITELDVSKFNTSKVTSMKSMFNQCSKLKDINVSNFDTSNVTDMSFMFRECNLLKELNLSNFNTKSVIYFQYMFYNCYSLEALDVSGFDVLSAENMSYMFTACSKLKSLDLSNFITTSVTDVNWMFGNCSSLEHLDISNFDTSKVISTYAMFYDCMSLEELDISSFNLENAENVEYMFSDMKKLKTIYVNDNFVINKNAKSSYMFLRDTLLTGENGTKYNSKYTNMIYAKVDSEEEPGYFTKK